MSCPSPLALFIVKRSHQYDGCSYVSTGLRASAQFIVDMLLSEGHRAKLVDAIDGNDVDRLLAKYRPNKVVIEAIWITPAKFAELQKLHPFVEWTVRVHSETPFLAQEGQATDWIIRYAKQGIEVAFNSVRTMEDFQVVARTSYLPNYYPLRKPRTHLPPPEKHIEVGCFGAIRPLKNQLIQACAAVRYAQIQGKRLVFNMNGSRVEQFGDNNLKNIQALIAGAGQKLVLHPWLDREEFLDLVATMDICLQVSLTESFNIVSADAVSMGVPLVGSAAIGWLPRRSQAHVDSSENIFRAMLLADSTSIAMNHDALLTYTNDVVSLWNQWVS